jgi:hypothetical protein
MSEEQGKQFTDLRESEMEQAQLIHKLRRKRRRGREGGWCL